MKKIFGILFLFILCSSFCCGCNHFSKKEIQKSEEHIAKILSERYPEDTFKVTWNYQNEPKIPSFFYMI